MDATLKDAVQREKQAPKMCSQTAPNSTIAYKNFTCVAFFSSPWCLVDRHGTVVFCSFADGVIPVDRARRCSRDAHQNDRPPCPLSSSSFAFPFARLSPPSIRRGCRFVFVDGKRGGWNVGGAWGIIFSYLPYPLVFSRSWVATM